MTPYLETILINTEKEADEFRAHARAALGNEHGRWLLARLIQARHPMQPRFNLTGERCDPLEAAFVDGQCDVIQMLWRYGSDLKAIPDPEAGRASAGKPQPRKKISSAVAKRESAKEQGS